MNDFNTRLIQAFAQVPAFYDKANPHFKDKAFIEQAWEQISKDLCYEVSMLKDRIYRLRNRYHLEKRKVLALKDKGIDNPKSNWEFFENLHFLDNHIKTRKSYKGMMRKKGFLFDIYKDTDQDYAPNDNIRLHESQRGLSPLEQKIEDEVGVLIQNEYETDNDDDYRENIDDLASPVKLLAHATESVKNDSQSIPVANTSFSNNGVNNEPSLTVRNIDSLKRSLQDSSANNSYREKDIKMHKASNKYEAYGHFVAASLQDLPETKALEIIKKCTSEIVRALIEN